MIRPVIRTFAGCFLCLPLFLGALHSQPEVRLRTPAPLEHDAHDIGRDIGSLSYGGRNLSNLNIRVSPPPLLTFDMDRYHLRGVDLARRQISRGLEKRRDSRRPRDQSFQGLRDIIEDSSDSDIRKFLPVVDRLERTMKQRDHNVDVDYVQGFITDFAPIAIQIERETGLPASVTLAQIILESGWGASNITILKNNILGIGNCRNPGQFTVEVPFAHREHEVRVRCMVDTTAYKFDSVGDSILYYTYLLLDNHKNESHYRALRDYIRTHSDLERTDRKAYRSRIIELIAEGYHSDPEWYESYLRKLVKVVDETGVLPRLRNNNFQIASLP